MEENARNGDVLNSFGGQKVPGRLARIQQRPRLHPRHPGDWGDQPRRNPNKIIFHQAVGGDHGRRNVQSAH